jgi:D-cysteine desulfhydrase
MARYSIEDIRSRIARFPRVELIHRPTPLRKLERLTAKLGGPEIYIKRDDLTGLAFGGNKSRKLEFSRNALDKQCATMITWGSIQSNWCLQTAAAATKHGLKTSLVLFKSYDLPPGYDGNMLLERILGAEMRIMEPPARGKAVKLKDTMGLMKEIAGNEARKGHKPYTDSGGPISLGSSDISGIRCRSKVGATSPFRALSGRFQGSS